MVGFGSNSSSKSGTIGSSRISRAQQSRQQRLAKSNARARGDEEVLVVSGVFAILCAFLVVCLGAGLMTIFFMVYQPECLRGLSVRSIDDASFAAPEAQQLAASTGSMPLLRRLKKILPQPLEGDREGRPREGDGVIGAAATSATPATPAASVVEAAAAAAVAETVWMPPQCTPSQLTKLAQQLPPGGCERSKSSPWRRTDCSFSMATTCHDPLWFRQHYGQAKTTTATFHSIHVGCNKGYQAIDMLAIGSKDPEKYDWQKWRKTFLENAPEKVIDNSESCPPAVVSFQKGEGGSNKAASSSKAQAYCIEPVPKTFQRLQETKDKLGIGDELQLIQLAMSEIQDEVWISNTEPIGVEGTGFQSWQKNGCDKEDSSKCTKVSVDTLDHWITNTSSIAPTDPIHYLSLGLEGYDYLALVGSATSLHRVHYLDIQYHWVGNWGVQHLADMLQRLKRRHFVCYFAGTENLWRITDCWQEHYDYRFYSNIACVNTEQAEPLAKEMEKIFEQTLEKSLVFGVK